jgi:hypothetical protein
MFIPTTPNGPVPVPVQDIRTLIHALLEGHFAPASLQSVVISERTFPQRVRADLQRAVDQLLEGSAITVSHFSGVRKRHLSPYEGLSFSELLVPDPHDLVVATPPQFEEIDIGEEKPVRTLKSGFWLLSTNGTKIAVLADHHISPFRRREVTRFQVATINDAQGLSAVQDFFKHLEGAVQRAVSYRGKILSLEATDSYSGASAGIKVHQLRRVERDQVILPAKTVELLDRNVIQFVRMRSRLDRLGLATKKGLLFYGPPGTGKTHTIHYLAGALEGHTTLLITSEQVALLGEYMTLARLLQPSIVIIEDADLIARDRDKMDGPCAESLLNKLLNEMDGLRPESEILFLLTTNRPEQLEAALASRPGRIDQAIEFPLPDDEGRKKLVRLYARGVELSEDLVENTVRRTEDVSASFIKELMRRATQFLLEREETGQLDLRDVDSALDEMLFAGGSLNSKLLGGRVEVDGRDDDN